MPKAFISYNWTTPEYRDLIIDYAKRLLDDGVDVVMDAFDLKEGDDKHAFMERMVNDPDVTHVLMFCDQRYVQKANGRQAGVGTESQIISKNVYEQVKQSKFVALVCEKAPDGRDPVPSFCAGRIYIDFSSAEAVNQNWEQLLRLLHDRPLHSKPKVGKMPDYLMTEAAPHNPAAAKFTSLRQSVLAGRTNVGAQRNDFIESVCVYVDELRPRVAPVEQDVGQFAHSQFQKLKPLRDLIVDWVLLESVSPSQGFDDALTNVLERLLSLSERPDEVNGWSEWWYSGHSLFKYEVFLYVIAALLKSGSVSGLHDVLTGHYATPETGRRGGSFETFDVFYEHGEVLQSVLTTGDRKYIVPAAELFKRNADRKDLPFKSLHEADALALVTAAVLKEPHWYPATLLYHDHGSFAFFQRATQHKGFARLATITGIGDADELRTKVKEGLEGMGLNRSSEFWHVVRTLSGSLHIDAWDTIK